MLASPEYPFRVPAWVARAFVVLFLSATTLHGQEAASKPAASPILATYDFETATPSGPDTYWLRENAGSVDLSTAFRTSGERSLHLREVPGDRDFSEFLAYFDERRSGTVYVQFYLLLTDLDTTLNVGVAGSRWFLNRVQHGHAIWLQTRDGQLRHHTASEWRNLLELRPFIWYFVDLMYDVERGTYAVAIFEEGREEPLVDQRDHLNFTGAEASSVRYLSFIGDLEDQGRFDFFVDDLLIATSPSVRQKPFIAPGRRSFFVERMAVTRTELSKQERDDLLNQVRQLLAASSEVLDADASTLLEQAADAAFAAGDLDLAEEIYLRLEPAHRVRMWLKLADVAHLRGDVERERELRESIYGRLELEEEKAN